MFKMSGRSAVVAVCLLASCVALDSSPEDAGPPPTPPATGERNSSGYGDSVFTNGLDPGNPFFVALGANGRACSTCHVQASGWSLTPSEVKARFAATDGTDPLFRSNDGATSPTADVSTLAARQSAYRMLLAKAVIRVGLPVPAGAEFTLAAVDDPYRFASAAELSLFRRPLPATNLRFLSSVMWDGREPTLDQQAADATLGHAQAAAADPERMTAIVAFESSISTAQTFDTLAGALDASGARGGPVQLASIDYQVGENDPFGGGFDRNVFTQYTAWDGQSGQRAAIARGERVFNTERMTITNVAGLNDLPGRATIQGSCATCHNATGAGGHSIALFVDIGLTTAARRTADQPQYTLRRNSDGAQTRTTDPGQALITGRWADLNKFKVPVLRALAMRAPYFHDGSAASLADVVEFYDTRFRMDLSGQDKSDLVAFLQAL